MYFLLEKTVDFPLNYVSYTLQAVEDLEREEVGMNEVVFQDPSWLSGDNYVRFRGSI